MYSNRAFRQQRTQSQCIITTRMQNQVCSAPSAISSIAAAMLPMALFAHNLYMASLTIVSNPLPLVTTFSAFVRINWCSASEYKVPGKMRVSNHVSAGM